MNDPNNNKVSPSPERGQPENYPQPGNDRNEDSKNQVVNEEEQNRAVNSGDQDWKESEASKEPLVNSNNTAENEKPDGGSEIEGDDANGIERKDPEYVKV